MKNIVFTATSDLSYDQRMQRICSTLQSGGFNVHLIGRLKRDSIPLKSTNFNQTRLKCFFEKGKLFYMEYNLRLLIKLIFLKADIISAVDLDTVVPCYLIALLRKKPLVYDAHEYFTEVIEVVDRPLVRKVWLSIEQWIVPNLKYAYTVSENLKRIFTEKYHVPFQLIRNISLLEDIPVGIIKQERYIVYAGVVNEGRGLEQLIDVMDQLPINLYICGSGDIIEKLKLKVKAGRLENKIIFKGNLTPELLKIVTQKATIGYLMLENKGLSYYYSLANKFFDYIHAGIPQVTINFPEYTYINNIYNVGVLSSIDSHQILQSFKLLLEDKELYNTLVANTKKAREEFNWQKESKKLLMFYQEIQ